jgi:pimeloyl-ACP methyl ester carboxylesterase
LVLPAALQMAKRRADALRGGVRVAARWQGLVPLLKRLGLVGQTLDQQVFNDLAEEFATLDFEAYAETFRYLGEHDARDLLPRIRVPALVITGSRDLMTPLPTARQMARDMPQGRLAVIPGGTHYTAVEFPTEVNRLLLEFLAAASA